MRQARQRGPMNLGLQKATIERMIRREGEDPARFDIKAHLDPDLRLPENISQLQRTYPHLELGHNGRGDYWDKMRKKARDRDPPPEHQEAAPMDDDEHDPEPEPTPGPDEEPAPDTPTIEEATAPTWTDIIPHPAVALVIGKKGQGKTALGHLLLERMARDTDRRAYIMGFPQDKEHLLPDWIVPWPSFRRPDEIPPNSVVLVHEAHRLLHARRSMSEGNISMDEMLTVHRHRNVTVLLETQQSQRLDRNAVAASDVVVSKWPAPLQENFERGGIQRIARRAREHLEKYVHKVEGDGWEYRKPTPELKKHAYVEGDRFRGLYPREIPLADHWTEDISRSYGDGDPSPPDTHDEAPCPHVQELEEAGIPSTQAKCAECR